MTSTPDGDLETPRLAEGEGRRQVVDVDAAGDRGRSSIDQQVEAEARPLVLAVAHDQHIAGQPSTQIVQRLSH
jgi:hypothetical protein